MKQADIYRGPEFVNKIENHFHRQDLEANLQQNNAYNPFSEKSKKMESIWTMCYWSCARQIQKRNECLLYWKQSIVSCICGRLLKDSEASRDAIHCTLDFRSVQNYVINKGRTHGHKFGKTQEQREHNSANNLRKKTSKGILNGFKIVS